jgi:hypothetical protein
MGDAQMSEPLKSNDPAYWMLQNGIQEEFAQASARAKGEEIPESKWVTSTTVYNERCYICNDREFALMGLPLCKPCVAEVDGVECGAHVPADDVECDNGHIDPRYEDYDPARD